MLETKNCIATFFYIIERPNGQIANDDDDAILYIGAADVVIQGDPSTY